jgi:hypothetical protein
MGADCRTAISSQQSAVSRTLRQGKKGKGKTERNLGALLFVASPYASVSVLALFAES